MALFNFSKSLTTLGVVRPAVVRQPISLKPMPASSMLMNRNIGIRYASGKQGDRIRDLHINKLTKNLDLFTASSSKRSLENGGSTPAEAGTSKSLKLKEGDNSQQPLVVMLPWLMSQNKHIAKYANFYLKIGFEVLTCRLTPWQLLWPAKGSQVVANDLLHFLDVNTRDRPILIHGFSVGGYLWGEVLSIAQADEARFKPVMNNIVGHIWDSAADMQDIPDGLPAAVFPRNMMLQNAFRKYVKYHMRTFYDGATCHYIRSSQMYHSSMVRTPALFLVSKRDPIGKPESNLKVAENWEALGIDVRFKVWNDSHHVGHFRKYPEEYIAEVAAFLAKIGLMPVACKARAKL
ncbi:transmembrane protein 53 [Neocloeon triangulifer]|uniref:transmembrane protein 53 n=1 Tax=Neocloeon triangulifer TaxID=2078957 RepID=UPI00286F008D|nr:transmembrane protein 53 [Neocloeon triangulifer]